MNNQEDMPFDEWYAKEAESIADFVDEFTGDRQRLWEERRWRELQEEAARRGEGHYVLDLFAGSGVGVAVQQLGAKEYGVEIMPEAVATRTANGMETVYNDVWDIHLASKYFFDTLWASPPCQAFSMAGRGAGRKALDDVLGVIARESWKSPTRLKREALELGDEKIGLVLTPLAYVYRYSPRYVAFEQVPPVLPVWEAMAVEMRKMGYSVWVGYLNSEQYGVPQTRKRAYLIAKRDAAWVACPPAPTHSRFYSRDPERLDPGVLPWVSMAEGLAELDAAPAPITLPVAEPLEEAA